MRDFEVHEGGKKMKGKCSRCSKCGAEEKHGDPSKTHKGDLDYTTKRGDRYFHRGHELVVGTPFPTTRT